MPEDEKVEKKEDSEIDMAKVARAKQLQLLDKIGSGGMTQNDLMAFMTMMQKQDSGGFGEMMPMIMAMKMMQPKQDQMSPMFLMMMMDQMKGGGSESDKKIEKLEAMIREREDKKAIETIITEIKTIKDSQNQIGIKDIIALTSQKDNAINEIKKIADNKDRELMMQRFDTQNLTLVSELKKLGSGGDITKVKETIGAIKGIYTDLGLEKAGQKTKEEVLTGLVQSVTETLAPAINQYVANMSQQQPQTQMTPEQAARLQQIRTQRSPQEMPSNPEPPPAPVAPPDPEQPESKPAGPQKDEFGDVVYPELIDVADSNKGKKK